MKTSGIGAAAGDGPDAALCPALRGKPAACLPAQFYKTW